MYNFEIKGILDDKFNNNKIKFYKNIKIIGKISDINKYKDHDIILTIGNIDFRKNFFSKYKDFNYPNLIHKSCYISDSVKFR